MFKKSLILILLTIFITFGASARISLVDQGKIVGLNPLVNGGFEAGLAGTTGSGSPTTDEIQTSNVDGSGKKALTFDPSADGDYRQFDAVTLNSGNYAACIRYKNSDSNMELNVHVGGVESATSAFSTSSVWTDNCVNFAVGSDASAVILRLEAEGDAVSGYYDNAVIALASRVNISNISQASFYGAATFPNTASCRWYDNSSTMEGYDADTDCVLPTGDNLSGNALAPTTKIPAIRFVNMPSADYLFIVTGNFKGTEGSSGHTECNWRLSDGTNHTKLVSTEGSTSTISNSTGISGRIRYDTTQSDVTIQVQYDLIDGSLCQVDASIADFTINVYRYPLDSQIAFKASTQMVASGVKITPNVSHYSSTTSATYEDATDTDVISTDKTHYGSAIITATDGDYGFKMPTVKAGRYFAFANATFFNNYVSTSTVCAWSINDGTNNITETSVGTDADGHSGYKTGTSGTVIYSSVQTDLEYTVQFKRVSGGGTCYVDNRYAIVEIGLIPIGESVNKPQILNNVESSASGGVRLTGAYIQSQALVYELGSWISSVDDNGAGDLSINVDAGIFSFTPVCVVSSAVTARACRYVQVSSSTTLVSIKCWNTTTATATDTHFSVTCQGEK